MPPAQDVLDRLLVAKGLLAKIRFLPVAHPDRISLSQAILAAHDAAELASAAVARHLNCLPASQKTYLMEILSAISKDQGAAIAGRDYFSQVNSVRNGLKHQGIFPNPQQWYRVGEVTYGYVSEWCKRYLGFSLDDLDESRLISNPEVRGFYDKANESFKQGHYKESLEYLAYAAETLFRSNQALRNLSVGNPKAEDAIKLAAFGVHANDYLALQEFLPSLRYKPSQNRKVVKWEQGKYGHPGNWTKAAVEFSLKTFVDVALRIQDADQIPGAIEFDLLYKYKITALVDGVNIFREEPGAGMIGIQNPERITIRTLNNGESILCDELSHKVKPPMNYFSGEEGTSVFSIVNLDQRIWGEVETNKVLVTCVPREGNFITKYFPGLPELDYKP